MYVIALTGRVLIPRMSNQPAVMRIMPASHIHRAHTRQKPREDHPTAKRCLPVLMLNIRLLDSFGEMFG